MSTSLRSGVLHAAFMAATLLSASVLQGQEVDWPPFHTNVRLRNDCRLAHQILTTGHPDPHESWAFGTIIRCGPLAGDVAAKTLRGSEPGLESRLDRLVNALWGLKDSTVFAAALEAARDRSIAEKARVQAFRLLFSQLSPNSDITYERIIGRSTEESATFDRDVIVGVTLPPDYAQQIASASGAIAADASESEAIRTAASFVRTAAEYEVARPIRP